MMISQDLPRPTRNPSSGIAQVVPRFAPVILVRNQAIGCTSLSCAFLAHFLIVVKAESGLSVSKVETIEFDVDPHVIHNTQGFLEAHPGGRADDARFPAVFTKDPNRE